LELLVTSGEIDLAMRRGPKTRTTILWVRFRDALAAMSLHFVLWVLDGMA
jgi:hypothetical protein